MRLVVVSVLTLLMLPSTIAAQYRQELLETFRTFEEDSPEWEILSLPADSTLPFVVLQKASLHNVDGNPRGWITFLALEDETSSLAEADCYERRLRFVAWYQYDAQGNLDDSSNIASGWDYTPPGTVGELIRERLCQSVDVP